MDCIKVPPPRLPPTSARSSRGFHQWGVLAESRGWEEESEAARANSVSLLRVSAPVWKPLYPLKLPTVASLVIHHPSLVSLKPAHSFLNSPLLHPSPSCPDLA